MKMNGVIVEELKKNFVVVKIDFYEDGKSIEHFIFKRSEISEEQVTKLYETYSELYSNDLFDGAFEDYLQEKGIHYDVLTFLEL